MMLGSVSLGPNTISRQVLVEQVDFQLFTVQYVLEIWSDMSAVALVHLSKCC